MKSMTYRSGSGAGGATAAWVLATRGPACSPRSGRMLIPGEKDFKTRYLAMGTAFPRRRQARRVRWLWKINEYTNQLTPTRARRSTAPIPSFTGPACAPSVATNTWDAPASATGRSISRPNPCRASARIGHLLRRPGTWYDKAERLTGVCGEAGQLLQHARRTTPDPHQAAATKLFLQSRAAKIGVPVFPSVPPVPERSPTTGGPPATIVGACGNGWRRARAFQQPRLIIPKLRRLPNFELRTNAVAHQILTNENGLARGISFFDALTRQH